MERYKKQINQIIYYIENNYEKKLTLKHLADMACFSEYHFQKVFLKYTGETPFDFIKRIKMENSVIQLINTKKSITDIAFDSNFSSSANYAKAFKSYYKISPNQCRKIKDLNLIENNNQQINNINIKLEELNSITVAYIKTKGIFNLKISIAWGKIHSWIRRSGLYNNKTEAIGIVYYDNNFPVYLSSLSIPPDTEILDNNIKVKHIAEGLFATINFIGRYSEINTICEFMYNYWLPKNKYKLRSNEVLQFYPTKKNTLNQNNSIIKICFPVAENLT